MQRISYGLIEKGDPWVRFLVQPKQRSKADAVLCEAPMVDHRSVKNSGGGTQERYVVRTTLRMGEYQWPIELTLTPRDDMGFRMLLGRTAVRNRFVVDAGRSYLQGGKPKKKRQHHR